MAKGGPRKFKTKSAFGGGKKGGGRKSRRSY